MDHLVEYHYGDQLYVSAPLSVQPQRGTQARLSARDQPSAALLAVQRLIRGLFRPALLFRDGRSERARYMRDPSAGVGLPGDPDQPDYTHRRAGAGIGRVDAFAPEFRFRRRTDYLRDGSYRCGSLRDRGDGLPRGGASGTDDDPPQHAR